MWRVKSDDVNIMHVMRIQQKSSGTDKLLSNAPVCENDKRSAASLRLVCLMVSALAPYYQGGRKYGNAVGSLAKMS